MRAVEKPEEKIPKKDSRFKIAIYLPNWIGDVVFTTPAIRAIKKAYPDSYLIAIALPRVVEVLRDNPYIDEIIQFDERRWLRNPFGLFRFVQNLKYRRIDMGFLFHESDTRALILRCARVGSIIGKKSRLRDALKLLDYSLDINKDNVHRVDYYLSMVKYLGIETDGEAYDICITPADRKAASNLIKSLHLPSERFIAINPGGNWHLKRWPKENYIGLIRLLLEEYPHSILLTGATKDIFYNEDIMRPFAHSGRVYNIAGKTTIKQLAAVFERAMCVISNDTGPLHISAAVNPNTIAIFGPTKREITGLYGSLAANNIQLPVDCKRPCFKKECQGLACMRGISPETVLEKVKDLIADKKEGV